MWILEKDKALHLTVGFAIAFVVCVILMFATALSPWWCMIIGAVVSLLASIGKEYVYDKWMGKGVFNLKDLWAGCIGDGLFIIVVSTLLLAL